MWPGLRVGLWLVWLRMWPELSSWIFSTCLGMEQALSGDSWKNNT